MKVQSEWTKSKIFWKQGSKRPSVCCVILPPSRSSVQGPLVLVSHGWWVLDLTDTVADSCEILWCGVSQALSMQKWYLHCLPLMITFPILKVTEDQDSLRNCQQRKCGRDSSSLTLTGRQWLASTDRLTYVSNIQGKWPPRQLSGPLAAPSGIRAHGPQGCHGLESWF